MNNACIFRHGLSVASAAASMKSINTCAPRAPASGSSTASKPAPTHRKWPGSSQPDGRSKTPWGLSDEDIAAAMIKYAAPRRSPKPAAPPGRPVRSPPRPRPRHQLRSHGKPRMAWRERLDTQSLDDASFAPSTTSSRTPPRPSAAAAHTHRYPCPAPPAPPH